jgi:hypothetical protein
MLFFIDLSDTEKKEAEALLVRNREVGRLMREKGCPGAPEEAKDRAEAPAPGRENGSS